jgi:anti-anti-sigma regulatory factor
VLRISRVDQEGAGVCLLVEGRLSGDWVDLLEHELAEASRTTPSLALDLAAVDFASQQATEMLRAATARGVRVIACSPFLAKLLVTSEP